MVPRNFLDAIDKDQKLVAKIEKRIDELKSTSYTKDTTKTRKKAESDFLSDVVSAYKGQIASVKVDKLTHEDYDISIRNTWNEIAKLYDTLDAKGTRRLESFELKNKKTIPKKHVPFRPMFLDADRVKADFEKPKTMYDLIAEGEKFQKLEKLITGENRHQITEKMRRKYEP